MLTICAIIWMYKFYEKSKILYEPRRERYKRSTSDTKIEASKGRDQQELMQWTLLYAIKRYLLVAEK